MMPKWGIDNFNPLSPSRSEGIGLGVAIGIWRRDGRAKNAAPRVEHDIGTMYPSPGEQRM